MTIKTNSNRGEEEDEDIVVVADIESVSTSLAKEVLTDAVATLKKHGGEEESSTDESDGGGKILEEKQWYVACVVRAIKASRDAHELAGTGNGRSSECLVERMRVL